MYALIERDTGCYNNFFPIIFVLFSQNDREQAGLSLCNLSFCIVTGLVLITDAIAAMGLPPGRHLLGTMEVDIDTKRAYLVGTKTLAGR